jgi:hypothetical protein
MTAEQEDVRTLAELAREALQIQDACNRVMIGWWQMGFHSLCWAWDYEGWPVPPRRVRAARGAAKQAKSRRRQLALFGGGKARG